MNGEPVDRLVRLDREYTFQPPDEPWEKWYARELVSRFSGPTEASL